MCSCSLYRANRVSHPRERAPDKPSSPRPYGRWFRAGRKGVRTGPRTAACKQSPGGDRRGRVSKLRRRLLALWAVVASAVMLGMLSVPLPAAANPQFQVIATVDVGVNPFGDTIAPDGNTVWVANAGTPGGASDHTVTVLDASTFATQSVIGVGIFAEDIAFACARSLQVALRSRGDADRFRRDAPGA